MAEEAKHGELVETGGVVSGPQACKERIEGSITKITTAFFDLATGLEEAYRNDYAGEWGYDNFRHYVEGRLDMKYRRAMYLVECGKAIKQLQLGRDQVAKIGWTRFKEIAPIVQEKPEDAERYLDMAESMSTRELQEELRNEVQTTDGRGATAPAMRMSLKFEGPVMNTMNDALATAATEIGTEDVHACLQHITAEWLLTKGAASEMSTLEDWMAHLEKIYGVSLTKVEKDESIDELLDSADAEEDAELNDLLGDNDADVEDLLDVQ